MTVLVEEIFQEDLTSKIPLLLKQFPEYNEDFIRQVAQVDPTENRADYITWLLRMLRNQQWHITGAEEMRTALGHFDRLKRLEGFNGPTDINSYETVERLLQAVRENESLKSKKALAKERTITGAKKLHEVDGLALWEITTSEAATVFGRGKGGLSNPSTVWCTKDPYHSSRYLAAGPLYTVTKDGEAYVQIHLPRKEAKDAANTPLAMPLAQEIAPVAAAISGQFEAAGFAYQPSGFTLSDERIEQYLESRMKPKFIAQRLHGFHKDGVWHPPVADTEALAQRWERAKPYFRQELVKAREGNDVLLLKQAGQFHPEPKEAQAVYNAVYEFTHAKPT